jgi:hypothetical protein
MAWGKLSDDYSTHPKTEIDSIVVLAAVGLHAKAIAHCAKHLTDGRITARWVNTQLHTLSRRQAAAVLTKALERGLFEEDDDHFQVHDYLAYNPSRADAEADRKASTERQTRARERRRQANLPWAEEASG